VINVHHFADQIEDFLHRHCNFGCDVTLSDERDVLLDTGGALKRALPLFDAAQPVVVHNVDIIADVDIAAITRRHSESGAVATLVVSERSASRCFLFGERMRLCGWRNNKTGEEKLVHSRISDLRTAYAFAGIHVVDLRIAPYFSPFPDKFSVVDGYLAVAEHEEVIGCNVGQTEITDVGTIDVYTEKQNII
jgi:NDP-sugar pyrophosphorylase family protein